MSTPATFDWEDLLKTFSSESTKSTSSTVVVPLPGESGGGSSKRFVLLAIDSVSSACICARYVGKGGLKRFCTQTVPAVGEACSKHSGVKFALEDDTFYVGATSQAAFCHPAYPQALVTDAEERERIRSEFRTQPEWKLYFSDLEARQLDALGKVDEGFFKPPVVVKLDFDPSLSLKTPAKRVIDGYVERMWETDLTPQIDVPKLPASNDNPTIFWERALSDWKQPAELIRTLRSLHEGFIGLSENWPVPFRDIERHFSLVGADLEKVQIAIEALRKDVGKPIPILDVDSPDIWCAIDHLATSLADIQHSSSDEGSIELLRKAILEIQEKQVLLGNAIQALQAQGVEFEGRFNMIGPIVKKLLSGSPTAGTGQSLASEDFERRLTRLEAKSSESVYDKLSERITQIELLSSGVKTKSWLDLGSAENDMGQPDARDSFAQLKAKVESLERRIVGDGLMIGMYVFQSFEDLRVWMKTHVVNNRYGLFVDVIALFELFCTEHVDASTTIGTFHSSQRTGFATMYESSLAFSMQNVLPTLLGKGSTDNMDTSRFLPGLNSPEKWSHNGVTGLRYQIERELPNVDSQLGAEINTAFADSMEASGLARECLFRSKRFIADLCHFITTDFEFWSGRGYARSDAWSLVCQSLRRIFEDIHSERVYGRHVKSGDDTLTAAKYVWAVLKAQQVMQDYSKRNFYEHPSVSAVVARHLASNHMKPSDDNKVLSTQVKRCETAVSELSRKFDALESRVVNKVNQIGGGAGGGGGNHKKGKKPQNEES